MNSKQPHIGQLVKLTEPAKKFFLKDSEELRILYEPGEGIKQVFEKFSQKERLVNSTFIIVSGNQEKSVFGYTKYSLILKSKHKNFWSSCKFRQHKKDFRGVKMKILGS